MMGDHTHPNVLYFEALPWEATYVESQLRDTGIAIFGAPLSGDFPLTAAQRDAAVVSVFLRSRVDARVLAQLPRLRLVVVRANHTAPVDVAACAARGVTVSTVSHFATAAVAEHTVALLLALSRQLLAPYIWSTSSCADPLEQWCGWELEGKTLGIVGIGQIGMRVARLGRAFGMEVLAADPQPDVSLAERLGLRLVSPVDLCHWRQPITVEELERTVPVVPLEELLARSDVVSLHLTAGPGQRHLIGAAALARMKPGAVLLNTADGALIDLPALRAALDSGQLAGAGLDVWEWDAAGSGGRDAEELPADLRRHPNVVLSRHNAFNSREARRRLVVAGVELIRRFVPGQPIPALATGPRTAPETVPTATATATIESPNVSDGAPLPGTV